MTLLEMMGAVFLWIVGAILYHLTRKYGKP